MKKLILLLFISNFAFAQTAKLDTNAILIGEQINFSISNTISETEVWPTYDAFLVEGIEIIKEGKLDMNKEMILFCAGGLRSALAAKSLKDMGFEKVSHVEGGFGAISQSDFKII